MKAITIHLGNLDNMIKFYVGKDVASTAVDLMNANQYEAKVVMMSVDGDIEYIADEMFDLTNNPYRQDERVANYGRGRSLSVGDIVEVDGKKVVCASMGWVAI